MQKIKTKMEMDNNNKLSYEQKEERSNGEPMYKHKLGFFVQIPANKS